MLANIIPIPKPNKHNIGTSCRPISLIYRCQNTVEDHTSNIILQSLHNMVIKPLYRLSIAQHSNMLQPPACTITVALDMTHPLHYFTEHALPKQTAFNKYTTHIKTHSTCTHQTTHIMHTHYHSHYIPEHQENKQIKINMFYNFAW